MPSAHRDEAAIGAFVEAFAARLTALGTPRQVARVLSVLLADEDGRMTAAEIGTALHVSPAAVSGAVTFLAGLGFVTKERERGSRRDVYVLHTDTWHDVTLQKAAMLGTLIDLLDKGAVSAGGAGTGAGRRLADSADFYRFIATETQQMMARWEERRPSPQH